VDLTVKRGDENNQRIQASRFQVEYDLQMAQHIWVNRLDSLFISNLGVISGMSLMHLILLIVESDR
jgi:hypothetical protein